MAQVLGLPKCVAIKAAMRPYGITQSYYLCTLQQEGDDQFPQEQEGYEKVSKKFGELSDESGGLSRPHVKFYLEPSKKHDGHVHVRCYNNKYWVPEKYEDGSNFYIVGTASEPEEDLSSASSTLFKATPNANGQHTKDPLNSVSFFHPGIKQYVHYASRADKEGAPKEKRPKDFFSFLETAGANAIFVHIDLSQHVVLPRYVCFKGNNGNYLRLRDDEYLEFTASEFADPRVINTVISNNDGTVRIKSNHNGRYWKLDRSVAGRRWIRASVVTVNATDRDQRFKVAKVGNYFTIQNLGSDNDLCESVNHDSTWYLAGLIPGNTGNNVGKIIKEESKLMLVEPVISREIYNVVYQGTDNPRIYGSTDLSMVSASAINRSSKESSKVKLSLKLAQTETRTWDTSVSHKAGVSTSIEVGIPKIGAGFSIEFDYEFSKAFSWGTVETKQKEQNVEYEVTVPPMKKVTVSAVATQAKCDVPFSYTQKDVLYNGEVEMSYHDDGMFTGMNSFDVQYVTKEEELKP